MLDKHNYVARMAGGLRFINHLSAGGKGDSPYSSTTAFLGTWGQVIYTFTLSRQKPNHNHNLNPNSNPNPVSERQLVVCALRSAWPSIYYDPQVAFSFGDPNFHESLALAFSFSQPYHLPVLFSTSRQVLSGSLTQVSLLCAWSGCLKSCIIIDRSSFFLTENLNIYRLQDALGMNFIYPQKQGSCSFY